MQYSTPKSLLLYAATIFAATACQRSEPPARSDAAAPESIVSAPPTHVIIISLDTARADWLACYGHPWIKTPNIDRFAADSILFEHAITPAPETLPAHTSLMTGAYPHTHGTPRNGFAVNPQNVMLPERLSAAGYRTAGFVSSFMLSYFVGFDQGYDHFDQDFDEPGGPNRHMGDQLSRPGWFTNERVFDYLDTADPNQPQFLLVHYWDPHLPYEAPDEYMALYADYPFDPASVTNHLRYPEGKNYIPENFGGDNMRSALQGYAAEMSYVDAHVGAFLDRLRDRGLYDRALILLTADHGETLWDHAPYFHHGMTLYDSTLHVPAIVKLPESAHRGTRIDTPVSTVDWVPSILAYLGQSAPDRVDGRDLRLVHAAADLATIPIYAESTMPYNAGDPEAKWFNERTGKAVTVDSFRLIERPYLEGVNAGEIKPVIWEPVPPARREDALFNRAADPGELHNLLASPEDAAKHGAQYQSFRALLDAFAAAANPLPSIQATTEMSTEELNEKLEALGYGQ